VDVCRDFVSSTILKVELGIELEMNSLDKSFKIGTSFVQPLFEGILSLMTRNSSRLDVSVSGSFRGTKSNNNSEHVLAEIERQCTNSIPRS
jgi:hypothetical protein